MEKLKKAINFLGLDLAHVEVATKPRYDCHGSSLLIDKAKDLVN